MESSEEELEESLRCRDCLTLSNSDGFLSSSKVDVDEFEDVLERLGAGSFSRFMSKTCSALLMVKSSSLLELEVWDEKEDFLTWNLGCSWDDLLSFLFKDVVSFLVSSDEDDDELEPEEEVDDFLVIKGTWLGWPWSALMTSARS